MITWASERHARGARRACHPGEFDIGIDVPFLLPKGTFTDQVADDENRVEAIAVRDRSREGGHRGTRRSRGLRPFRTLMKSRFTFEKGSRPPC
ncbi:hypothetical protein [Amycolatopsis sp. cmx-4-61]|uniref:hypothetical protein n=1 Tax=Amycolatopsis sp. cmx-4-61 TaxID=2790937 RepID=UPI00397C4715